MTDEQISVRAERIETRPAIDEQLHTASKRQARQPRQGRDDVATGKPLHDPLEVHVPFIDDRRERR